MKGIICYYSGTGNTKLACQYITRNVEAVAFDLFDIAKGEVADLQGYDVAGFATFTDFLGPPRLFYTFVAGLERQDGMPAFVFNTYGNMSGRTLTALERLVAARGFRVIAGHSLHTPENYPPMIAGGKGNEQAPDERELREFKAFVAGLSKMLDGLKAGQEISPQRIRVGLPNNLMPVLPRTTARRQMGEKYVDESLCTECGVCAKMCPYQAIRLDPKPIFDQRKCYGCWRCYNRCPQKAIYTRKLRGMAHYPKPLETLREKLGEIPSTRISEV